MLDHVRVPVAIAALTTMIGFATLIFTRSTPIRDFGIYSVFGIAVDPSSPRSPHPGALVLLPICRRAGRGAWRVAGLAAVLRRDRTLVGAHRRTGR